MQLYIIRHAQSESNAEPNYRKHPADPALTEIGQEQASLLGQYLQKGYEDELSMGFRFTHMLISPMLRTLQTAAPVREVYRNIPANVRVDIHEHGGAVRWSSGGYVNEYGLTRAKMSEMFPTYELPPEVREDGWWHNGHGLESRQECRDRAEIIAADLLSRARDLAESRKTESVALVIHGTLINDLIHAIFGLKNDNYYYFHYNTAITRIDYVDGCPVMRYTNRVDHLPRDLYTH